MPQRSNSNRNRGRNNNPEGRNQYSSDWMDTVRERPMASAAAAAAAVGAGVFLWSKRNLISDQISNLSGQISDWAENMQSGSTGREMEMAGGSNESMQSTGTVGTGGNRNASGSGTTAKARRTSGRAMPQSTTM